MKVTPACDATIMAAPRSPSILRIMPFLTLVRELCLIAAALCFMANQLWRHPASHASDIRPPRKEAIATAEQRSGARVAARQLQTVAPPPPPSPACACYGTGYYWEEVLAELNSYYSYEGAPMCVIANMNPQAPTETLYSSPVFMPLCNQLANATALASLTSTVDELVSAVASNTAVLSCGSGGRRLETEPAAISAKAVMDEFLARRPDFVAKMDDELLTGLQELGEDFGLPARV